MVRGQLRWANRAAADSGVLARDINHALVCAHDWDDAHLADIAVNLKCRNLEVSYLLIAGGSRHARRRVGE